MAAGVDAPQGGAGSGPRRGRPGAAGEPLGEKGSAGGGGEGAHTQGRGPRGQGHGSPPRARAGTSGTAGPPGETRPRDPTATDTRAVPQPSSPGHRPALGTTAEPPHGTRTPPPGAPKRPQRQARRQGDMPRISSIRDPVPLRDTATPHGGDAFPGPGGPTRHPAHSAVAGTSHGSARHGSGQRAGSQRKGVTRQTGRATRTQRSSDDLPNGEDAGPGPARRDPPPTQRGEARATVGDERRSVPTAGTGGTLSSPSPRRRRELCLHTSESDRYGSATTTQREAAGRGEYGTPRHTSRIAREGFLTEGGSRSHTPTGRPSSGRPRRRSGTPGEGRGMRSTARGGTPEAPLNPAWVRGAPRSTASTTPPPDELNSSSGPTRRPRGGNRRKGPRGWERHHRSASGT